MNCCICSNPIIPQRNELGEIVWSQGHNAEPVMDGRCCNDCNSGIVIPIRLAGIVKEKFSDSETT